MERSTKIIGKLLFNFMALLAMMSFYSCDKITSEPLPQNRININAKNLHLTAIQGDSISFSLIDSLKILSDYTVSFGVSQNLGSATNTPHDVFVMKPQADFYGTDSIAYYISNNTSSDTGYIVCHITKKEIPCHIALMNDVDTIQVGTPAYINILLNDTICAAKSISIIVQPKYGRAILESNNYLTYTYSGGVNPSISNRFYDELVYQVCDTNGECHTAKVKIHIVRREIPCEERFHPNDDFFEIDPDQKFYFRPKALVRNDDACIRDIDTSSFTLNYTNLQYGGIRQDSIHPEIYVYIPFPRSRRVTEVMEYSIRRSGTPSVVKSARLYIRID